MRPDTYQSFGHAAADRVTLWAYGPSGLEARDGTGADNHDAWWDMDTVSAFGRVCGGTGSLVVEMQATRSQRRLGNALVGRFPSVKFWVWGRGWHGAKDMQEWWRGISEEAA